MNKKNFLLMGLAAALFGCANPIHQVIVDAKVDDLCAKDGKAIVYERETMPFSQAKIVFGKEYVKPGVTHYWDSRSTMLEGTQSGAISGIIRTNKKLVRVSDSHTLGEHNYYYRVGGDFLPGHPSSYACKNPEAKGGAVVRGVFVLNGDNE